MGKTLRKDKGDIMALKRRPMSKNSSKVPYVPKVSDESDSDESVNIQGIRDIKPIDNLDEGTDDDENMSAKVGGGPINAIRNGLSTIASGVGNAVTSGVSSLFGLKSVGVKVNSGVEKIANYTHLPKTAVSVVLAVALCGGSGTALMVHNSNALNTLLIRQEDVDDDDCSEDIANMTTASFEDTDGNVEENARKAWAVGKALGMTDEQCAGMLGNMQGESGMDPTTIEAIYGEAFNINGAKKKAAASDLCAYVTTTMRQIYIRSGWGIKPHTTKAGCTMAGAVSGKHNILSSAYEGTDGHFFPGIGLFGFTGPEGNALVSYAESGNKNWWDFDVQLAFIFDTTGGYSRASKVEEWIAHPTQCGSPAEAATWWNVNFEGNAGNVFGERKGKIAEKWFVKLKGYSDDAYAQSVIALANSIQGGATSVAIKVAESKCSDSASTSTADNSDLARAAVAYAYKTRDEGVNNDGTELYRFLCSTIFGSSAPPFQSCDRSVATAVRWSEADVDFPVGNTNIQRAHAITDTAHWENLGPAVDMQNSNQLQPGDVCIANGHIVMYVGNEIIKEKYPDASPDVDFVSGSIGGPSRSPGCTADDFNRDTRDYLCFRLKKYDNTGEYKDIAVGQNLADGR